MTRSESPRSVGVSRLPPVIRDVIAAAHDRKAVDVVVLNLLDSGAFTDYFVVCSGRNPRQIRAIAEAIETTLKAVGMRPNHVEGFESADWILVDCFDFIVHVFNPETRAFYALERLWGDAKRIEVPGGDEDE